MLTGKQERFVVEYIQTGNASEAYRRAYDAESMMESTLNKRASELLHHGEIAGRIESLRAKAADKATLTLAQHMQRLADLSEKAESAEQFSASVKAEELRGKVSGFYVEKVEHSGSSAPVRVTFTLDKPNGNSAGV